MGLISILYWVPSSYFEYVSRSSRLKYSQVQGKFPRNVDQSCVVVFPSCWMKFFPFYGWVKTPNALFFQMNWWEGILIMNEFLRSQSPLWQCWWHIELNINYSEGHFANLLNYFRLLINKMDIFPLGRRSSNLSRKKSFKELCNNQALSRDVHMWYIVLRLLWWITELVDQQSALKYKKNPFVQPPA